MKKFIILQILFCCLAYNIKAQEGSLSLTTTVKNLQPQFAAEGDNTFASTMVTSNVTNPITFKFNLIFYGDGVLLGQTDLNTAPQYTCNPGDQLANLSPFDPELVSLTSYNGFKESMIAGILPIHNYHICLSLVDPNTLQSITGDQCFDFTVQQYVFPNLIFPENGSTISNQSYQVKFKWSSITPSPIVHEFYRIKVVKINAGQSALNALANNLPALLIDSLTDTTYSWRQYCDSVIHDSNYTFPVLNYVWQVSAYYANGTSLGLSSVYTFTSGSVALIAQGSVFSSAIAEENAATLEVPEEEVAEYVNVEEVKFYASSQTYASAAQQTTTCDNGNWEHGDNRNWTGEMGTRSGANGLIVFTSQNFDGAGIRHHLIPSTEAPVFDDVVGGNILRRVLPGGSFTMRLGAPIQNSNTAQGLKYQYPLDATNPKVRFRYALVMEGSINPKHNPVIDESVFKVQITGYKDALGNITDFNNPIGLLEIHADANDPSALIQAADNLNGHVFYKNWTCESISLPTSAKVGTRDVNLAGLIVIVEFITANCKPGGHYSYAYIDGICDVTDPTLAAFTLGNSFCIGDDIIADASGSFGARNYMWSIQESDWQWNRSGTEFTKWFIGQTPSKQDIKTLYSSLGGHLKTDQWYVIKLVIANDCNAWTETTKLIYIKPQIIADAGPNYFECVGQTPQSITLGGDMLANPTGTTYSWTSTPSGFTSNLDHPIVAPTSTITYNLTVTQPPNSSYCGPAKASTTVTFTLGITDFTISDNGTICSGHTLSITSILPSGAVPANVVWYLYGTNTVVGTGVTIHVDGTTIQIYSVTVTDACGHSITKTIRTTVVNYPYSDWNVYIICANAFYAYQGPIKFPQFGLDWNERPAYEAYKYQLLIINRWGGYVRTITGTASASGFANGDIQWDGKTDGGQWAPYSSSGHPSDGIYRAHINLYDCKGNLFTPIVWQHTCHWEGFFLWPHLVCQDTYVRGIANIMVF
jgi:hypothetical protein